MKKPVISMKKGFFVLMLICMGLYLMFAGCDNSPSSTQSDPAQTDSTDTPIITTKNQEHNIPPSVTTQTSEPTGTEPTPPTPPVSLIGNVQAPSKITENLETRTIVLAQKNEKGFYAEFAR